MDFRDQAALTLADEAVYRRTRVGQRELVIPSGALSPLEHRLLGVFTGYTPLRTVAELVDDVGFGLAIERLLRIGLIERVALPTAAPGDIPDPPGTFW